MRPMTLAILCAVFASPAAAADRSFDSSVLRGSDYSSFDEPARAIQPTASLGYRWDGLYIGGQMGRSWGTGNFGRTANQLLDQPFGNTVVGSYLPYFPGLPNGDASSTDYGGFVGYNTSWEGAMLGIEMNYSKMNNNITSSNSLGRTYNDDTAAPAGHHYYYAITSSGDASVRVTDLATFRARAGWEAGAFMPYAFGGLAVARVDVQRSATVRYTRSDIPDVTDPVTPALPTVNYGPITETSNKNGKFAFGWAAGLGVDVAVLPGVFVRGEWEYVQLAPIEGIRVGINSVRAGVAVKF